MGTYRKNGVVAYSLKIGEYVVNYKEADKKVEVIKNGTIEEKPNGSTVSGPTMTAPSEADTHKGIVYLDPTDLNKTCNASNSVSTTETKEGCMKWYIFDDSGNNYTMLLDHNTTARIKWNDANINVSYESSNLKSVVDDLVTTNKWKLSPRLITAAEVNIITGKTDFDSNSTNSWYYLDGNNQTQTATSKGASKYAWLFDYTKECTSYGCNIADSSNYGYWTSTPTASNSSRVCSVNRSGDLDGNLVGRTYRGVRPVITVSKSVIS